ncbi:MAG: ferritin-like domain-containing protein [Myxococcales bacterium]|nr:ferritin-like domain-containing protein [Myxococcales bacterium]
MIRYVTAPPQGPSVFDPDGQLGPEDVAQIGEVFSTPLTTSYSWNYREADRRIAKLYRLGKQRNWDAELDIDWSPEFVWASGPALMEASDPYIGWEPYDKLTEDERLEFQWHGNAWTLSQFMHGEQGALLVAAQLANSAPTYEAKLYAASQVFDEARHVEAFSRYLNTRVGIVYPINAALKDLLDRILTDPRWDLKFIGMQLIIETLALSAFDVQRSVSADPVVRDLYENVMRDESRHVAFGVTYMDQVVAQLSPDEVEERAEFALEACRIMRDRIVPTDVFDHYADRGLDAEEGRRRFLEAGEMDTFRNLLFTRIMPTLNRLGLVTESVRPGYDELGLLRFADQPLATDEELELDT